MNELSASSTLGQGSSHVAIKRSSHGKHAKSRGLLALDGTHLTAKVLLAAETRCLQMLDEVYILLVNSPAAPTSVLHKLLTSLERAGIDYRLTSTSGNLGDEMSRYLLRFVGITLIMVATLPILGKEWNMKVADLRYQGYRFSTLIGLEEAG